MSVQIETRKMTDKFGKELDKFMKWAEENDYRIRNKNGEDKKKWNKELLTSFVEPARNKLETYIKELIKEYVIEKDEDEIEDPKLLAKEFKECKPKRKRQTELETDNDSKSSDKESNIEKTKKGKNKEVKEKVKRVTKKSKKENNNDDNVIVNMKLDTTNTYYLDTLEFTTIELVNKLGEPNKTGGKDDKHRYEWKLMINNNVYSIYDWCKYGKFEEFENEKWYIGGTSDDKKNVDKLIEYIKNNDAKSEIKNTKQTKKSQNKEEKTKKQKKRQEETVEENQELSELEQLEKELGLQDDLDFETEIDENEDKKSVVHELDTTNLELFGEEEQDDMLDLDDLDNMI